MSRKIGARVQLSMLDFTTAANNSSNSRTDAEPPKKKPLTAPPKPAPIEAHGKWDSQHSGLLVYTPNSIEARSKVAGFDLDGTLVKTKSGNVFPKNANDWQLWSSKIPNKLKQLHADGYKIVIFTNQKGITTGQTKPHEFKNKIVNVIKSLQVPVQAFVSTGMLTYRKPHVGMWLELEKSYNDDVTIDREESLYCGDAAGRYRTGGKKADHSSADRAFALNLGVHFQTPEQLFLGQREEEPYTIGGFQPADYFSMTRERFEPADAQFPNEAGKKELIVMVGPQASGKSHVSKHLAQEHGYKIVNQDTLGNKNACEQSVSKLLNDGQNIIVDNTNRDPKTRTYYVKAAKARGYFVRTIVMNCNEEMVRHNNTYRQIVGADKAHVNINTMIIRTFFKDYREPSTSEGFDEIIYCNFIPDFKDDKSRGIYNYILNEK